MANDIKQKIQDFFRVAQQRDFARDFQFRVLDITDRGVSVVTQDDLVYATTGSVPGRSITNIQVPYMGLQFNVPGSMTYPGSNAYPIVFYSDADNVIRNVFERWSTITFDDNTSTGDYRLFDSSIITIAQLNQRFDVVRTYKLIGAYPVEVGALEYTPAAGTGTVVNFTATLAYQFWRKDSLAV